MAKATAAKGTATKRGAKAAAEPNALVEVADAAQRKLLLATLKRHRWNLAHSATELRLHGAPAVIRYLRRLGLGAEYDAARADGRVAPGAPPKA